MKQNGVEASIFIISLVSRQFLLLFAHYDEFWTAFGRCVPVRAFNGPCHAARKEDE